MEIKNKSTIGSFFDNYLNFRGKATRSEFWIPTLFVLGAYIVILVVAIVIMTAAGPSVTFLVLIPWLWFIFCIIPLSSVTIRRLHDTGHRWFWLFVPVANFILMFMPSFEKTVPSEITNNKQANLTKWTAIASTSMLAIVVAIFSINTMLAENKTSIANSIDASSIISDKIAYVSTIIESTLDRAEKEGMEGKAIGTSHDIEFFSYDGHTQGAIVLLSNGETKSKPLSGIIPLTRIYQIINESPEYINDIRRGVDTTYEGIGTFENYVVEIHQADFVPYIFVLTVPEGKQEISRFGFSKGTSGDGNNTIYDITYGGPKSFK